MRIVVHGQQAFGKAMLEARLMREGYSTGQLIVVDGGSVLV